MMKSMTTGRFRRGLAPLATATIIASACVENPATVRGLGPPRADRLRVRGEPGRPPLSDTSSPGSAGAV